MKLLRNKSNPADRCAPAQLFVSIMKKIVFDIPSSYTYNARVMEVFYAEEINHNSR